MLAVSSRRWLDPAVTEPWIRQCAACGARLPSLAWLAPAGGRCVACGHPATWRERLLALGTGAVAAGAGLLFPDWRQAVPAALLLAVLWLAAWIDLEARLIPDRLLAVAVVGALLVAISWPPAPWQSALFGAVLLGGFTLLLALFSRGGLGGGDVKLAAVIGLYLGPLAGVLALLAAFLGAGLWAALMLATHRRQGRDSFALAPYLAAAAALVVVLRLSSLPFWGGAGVP